MELEIDPSGITITDTTTNTNNVAIDSSNIDISGTHKIILNDTNGISINNLTLQPTNTLGSATNITIDELAHLSGVSSNIQTQFNLLKGDAPAALDTIAELADAIGDNANFLTNVNNDIAAKVGKTGDETISGNKNFSGDTNFTGDVSTNNVSSSLNYKTYVDQTNLSLYGVGSVFNDWDQRYGGVSLVGSQTDRGFGKRVRFSGNGLRLAISEPYYDGNQGRVRVYNIAQYGSASYGGNNIISQYGNDIPAEVNSQNYSGFGLAINDDGTIVAVGSPYNHNTHARAGTVKVYQNTGSGWSQLGSDLDNTLQVPGSSSFYPDALRGFSISLNSNGTRILIGTFNNPGDGRVEIFDWDGSSWNTVGTGPNGPGRIHGGSSGNERWLGRCVSLSSNGNRLAAGSQNHPSGRIEIWDLISGTWTESITLNIGDTESGPEDYFALSGNGQYLIYGECGNDTNGTDRGVVKVLTLGSNTYTQRGSSIYGAQNGANFGKSVSINYDGSVIAVGACDTDTNSTNSGYVKTYEWNGTDWAQKGSTFEDGTNNETHRFGENVSLSNSGSHLAIGIPKAPDNGVIKGTVKVYEFIQWVQGIGVNSNYEYAKMTSTPSGSGSSFERHKAYARSLGGDLASIHNADENAMVHSFTDSGHTYLIGLERDNPTDTWSWSDGSTFDYNNINSSENSQTSEDYAGIGYSSSGEWSTHSSGESRAIYKRLITTQVVNESLTYQNTIDASNMKLNATTLTTSKEINIDNINTKIDICGNNSIIISDASGIKVNNLEITPSGSFDICGGNFTVSIEELSKLDGVSDNIQSQINTAIAGNVWDQSGVKIHYNSGNVGIGTNDPIGKLEVHDGPIIVKPGTNATNALQFHSGSGNTYYTNDIAWYDSGPTKKVMIGSSSNNTTGHFRFWENGSQYFTFINDVSNTRVGINRVDPQYNLDVSGDINLTGTLYQNGSEFNPSLWSESNGNVYRSSGNVGIGTTNPLALFHTKGNGRFDGQLKLTCTTSLNHQLNIEMKNTSYAEIQTIQQGVGYNQNLSLQPVQGKVGIGTTSPDTPLHIRSAGTLGQVLKVSNTAANSSAWIELECLAGSGSAQQWGLNSAEGGQFRIYKRTGIGAGTWALNIDGDGKVGIGDITPSYKLDVAGDVNFTGNLYKNGSLFSSGGGGGGAFTSGTGKAYYTGGNVGIGTTNPTNVLDVDGSGGREGTQHRTGGSLYVTMLSQSDSDGVEFRHKNGSQGIGFGHNTIYATGYNTVQHLNLKPRGSGGVGIGTTNPACKLHVKDTGYEGKIIIENDSLALLQLKQPSSNKTFNIELGRTAGELTLRSTTGEKLRIKENGYVGIGTTTPSCPLEVNGYSSPSVSGHGFLWGFTDIYARTDFSSTNGGTEAAKISIEAEYSIKCKYSVIASDIRIKKDFEDVNDDEALNIVNSLEICKYNYKEPERNNELKTIGFKAQQVKEVLPNAVKIKTDIVPDIMLNVIDPIWEEIVDLSGNNKDIIDLSGNNEDITDLSGNNKYKLIYEIDLSGNEYTGNVQFIVLDGEKEQKKIVKYEDGGFVFEKQYDKLICIGREVNDFHLLNKDIIFGVGISAIQELSRRNDALNTEKETMQTQITTLLEENNSMKSRLEALEAAIINLQNN